MLDFPEHTNTVLKFDRSLMPAMNEILQSLLGSYVLAIESSQRFQQLALKKEDRYKLGFVTHHETF